MSCYFRHIKDMLAEQGIEVTAKNRKAIDLAVQKAVGTEGEHCPATWRKVKEQIAGEETRRAFVQRVKEALQPEGPVNPVNIVKRKAGE